LIALLEELEVLVHPFIEGELALGGLTRRGQILEALRDLPRATVARHEETLAFVERHRLSGAGIGWVDAHLLASAALDQARLWTRDQRLAAAAARLGLAALT
jgi:hypothetical protein